MNPNVKVIEAARDAFPKDHYMYGALDHAAAELAVLHLRCQRATLMPPEGYVLVRTDDLRELCDGAWEWHVFCEWPADVFEQKMAPVRAALESINASPKELK